GETAKAIAAEFPGVEFCQATCENANTEPVRANYHTFMGEIYEGRYVAGLVAGLKLQELIDSGEIAADEAWIGHVGAYPYAECISGFTSFFLGVRETCPTARMRVKYAYTWSDYMLERKFAKELIEEGCVIISQDSDTIGPAVECENAKADHPVFHVSYNQDMIDVAPTTSLTGTRFDWSPYICGAVGALLDEKRIEDVIPGNVHGNDIGAGFSKGWVKMLELNRAIAPAGSEELIRRTVREIEAGKIHVFKGNYVGVDPDDPNDVWDLNTEFP
ncbi:MAG: BMP family ABC transporter substrate-binding protein, partial [Firmicutes bacterium]|nr:BMP family ABC transporter substrate-binding protein [Bacillota bacterium]